MSLLFPAAMPGAKLLSQTSEEAQEELANVFEMIV
jgi:hypothetical protein